MPTYTSYVPMTKFGNWPAIYPPLYPMMLALSFKIFGVSDTSAVLVNGFFFVATIPILYFLAKKVFNQKVATLTCIWYIGTPAILLYSITPITEPLFTFLAVLLAYLTIKRRLFLCGLVAGAAFMTKFQGILLLPSILIFISLTQKSGRLRAVFQFIGAFLIVAAIQKLFLPSQASDFSKLSDHFIWNAVAYETIIPRGYLSSSIAPITSQTIIADMDLIAKKIFSNSFLLLQNIVTNSHTLIFTLFALSFITGNRQRASRNLTLLTLLFLTIFAIFHIITIFDMRYVYPFLPLMLIPAAKFLLDLAPKKIIPTYRIIFALIIIVPLVTFPGLATSAQRSLKPHKPTIPALLAQIASQNTDQNAIVATEAATYTAWYGNRRSLLLPTTVEELLTIDAGNFPINSTLLYSLPGNPQNPNWQELIDHPHGFGNFQYSQEFYIAPEQNYSNIPVKVVIYKKLK